VALRMTISFDTRSFNVADQENRMMSSVLARGRARVLGALTLLAGVLVLAAGAGQAHAAGATIWPYAGALTPSALTGASEIAANHESGNLLMFNNLPGDIAILQMDESGAPVPFTDPALAGATALRADNVPGGLADPYGIFDIAVDNTGTASQGNIYVVTADAVFPTFEWVYRVQGFKASGESLFDVTRPGQGSGLGIAPDGDVWVGLKDRMEELTSAGTPTGSVIEIPSDVGGDDRAAESEFDAAGNMYIMLRGRGRVVRRSPSGAFRVFSSDSNGLAVDPATGNVLSARIREGVRGIDQYGPDGELEGTTGAGILPTSAPAGSLALGRDGRTLFYLWFDGTVLQSGIHVFGPAIRRPEADAASGVGTTSATLTGVVRPGGEPTTYEFEFGTTKSLGSVAPSAPVDAGSGTGPVTATATLSGLKPQTFYYYRLKATVGGAVVYGKVRSLRTGGPAAAVSAVADLRPISASFNGSVDPFDLDGASFHFLVEGVGSPFSAASAETSVSAGSGPRQVAAPVTGLQPGQRYTVRLLATAGGVTESSAPVSFQTPELGAVTPVPEGPSSPSPYGCVAPTIATLKGPVREGAVVTLHGSDLGLGGTVSVNGSRVRSTSWSASSVSFVVPEVGAGKVPVRVSCGRASNSVELAVTAAPSNMFRLGAGAVKGSSAAVAVALPGPGKVVTTGKYLAKSSVKVKKAGRLSVQVRLTAAGKRALAKSRSGAVKVTVQVRYTPTGGPGRTLSKSITFKRGGSR
jgi:hypothetical protein